MFTMLTLAADLAGHLDDPHWLVVDCRFDLARPAAGEAAWQSAHIPGAVYAHLDRDLSGPVSADSGRHPLPHPAAFAATLSRWGVGPGVQVVAYDDAGGAVASRLWWMLRWAGHDAAAVLDGGLAAWVRAGGRLDASTRARPAGTFPLRTRAALVASAVEVAAGEALVVDARAADRFAGRVEPIDPVAGHVPGAVNHPFQRNLADDGRFLPPAELAERWRATLGGRPGSEAICMCGSGVTACHDILALELAGQAGARLYAGSWSEWIRDPGRPVARAG